MGKHNKSTRASDVSLIENFEHFKIFPLLYPKINFLDVKGKQLTKYINVSQYPSKISHWGAKRMIEWPIYRNFSVFSQNSGYFDQNEKGVKKCPFPQSLRFCHNWWASGGVPGVRYAEKLSALFYLHWESLWPGVCQAKTEEFQANFSTIELHSLCRNTQLQIQLQFYVFYKWFKFCF